VKTGRLVGPAEAGRVIEEIPCFLLFTGEDGAEPADVIEEKKERSGVRLENLSLNAAKGPS
jgi:hypothetical protein